MSSASQIAANETHMTDKVLVLEGVANLVDQDRKREEKVPALCLRDVTKLRNEGWWGILQNALITNLVIVAVVDQVELGTDTDVGSPGQRGAKSQPFAVEDRVTITAVVDASDNGVEHGVPILRAGKGETAVVLIEALVGVAARVAGVPENRAFAPGLLGGREVPFQVLADAWWTRVVVMSESDFHRDLNELLLFFRALAGVCPGSGQGREQAEQDTQKEGLHVCLLLGA